MNSRAISQFWERYKDLPPDIQVLAKKQYRLWKDNSYHPSVRFKKIGGYWSARVNDDYRALAVMDKETVIWFWIGSHQEYDRLIKKLS
jgi:hypothetical protein